MLCKYRYIKMNKEYDLLCAKWIRQKVVNGVHYNHDFEVFQSCNVVIIILNYIILLSNFVPEGSQLLAY